MDLWVLELLRYIRKWTEEIHTSSNKLMHFFCGNLWINFQGFFVFHRAPLNQWAFSGLRELAIMNGHVMTLNNLLVMNEPILNSFITPEDCQILHLFSLQALIGVPFSPIRFSTILKLLNWTWTWSIYLDVLISYCYNARSFLKYFFDFKKVRSSFLKVILEYA